MSLKPIEEIVMPKHPLIETVRITQEQRMKTEALVYTKTFLRDPITGIKSAAVKCICSACGESYYSGYQPGAECASYAYAPYGFNDISGKKITHSEETSCECCGETVEAVWAARAKGGYVLERIYPLELRKVEGYATLCGWKAEKSVDQDGRTQIKYIPWEAYIPEEIKKGRIRIHRFTGHVRNMGGRETVYGRFVLRKKYADEWGAGMITYAEPGCLEGTCVENSRWDAFTEIARYPVSYIEKWKHHRVLEAMIAEGGIRIVDDFLKEMWNCCSYYGKESMKPGKIPGILDHETRPSAALGLTKDEWKICLEDGWNMKLVRLFDRAKREGKGWKPEETREIMKLGDKRVEELYEYLH